MKLKLSVGSARLSAVVSVFAFLLAGVSAQTAFLRMSKPSATVEVLETKAQKFVPANGEGPAIWLVGVAHVGKSDYYKEIQKLLDEQTLVLYEGVNKKGVDPAQKSADSKKGSTYQIFSDTLGLEFQLQAIDYKKSTFKNSDLSWEEMEELEKKNPPKEGAPKLSMIGNLLDPNSPQGQQVAAFFGMIKDDPSSCEAMRLAMIEMLSTPGALDKMLSPDLNDLIVKKRNAKVFEDLKKDIPSQKSIAIFYGAGHMGDMESRLQAMGYKAGDERWFKAIEGDTSKVEGQGKMILDTVRAQMKKGGGG